MSNFGYQFDPDARVTGYVALTVNLRAVPTEAHYDPERLTTQALTLAGDVRRLAVQHPWHDRSDWHTAPGCVDLIDRKGKVVQAFTFGGALHVASHEQMTTCVIRSPAPIFEVVRGTATGALDAVSIFIQQVVTLFARARVTWRGDDAGFLRNLSSIDPALLYAACRRAVRSHLTAQPEHLRLTRYRSTLHLLRSLEIEDPIPGYVAPLCELLDYQSQSL